MVVVADYLPSPSLTATVLPSTLLLAVLQKGELCTISLDIETDIIDAHRTVYSTDLINSER